MQVKTIPTEYWSHPIEPNNRNWAMVAGNYPWGETLVGQQPVSWSDEYYGPFIPAVHTPHIVWQRVGPVCRHDRRRNRSTACLAGPAELQA